MAKLRMEFDFFAACGFDAVELSIPGLYLILNGRLDERRAERTQAILRQFSFRYTLHLPDNLNLASPAEPKSAYSIACECLSFAAAARAEVAVYHCGLDFVETKDLQALGAARRQEVEQLQSLASKAEQHGVLIAVENSDPRRGEQLQLAALSISGSEARQLHPALDPSAVAAEVAEVGHPNVGMTLDFGHFYLASALTGQEFLPTIEAVSRRVDHIHLNDNFGRLAPAGLSRMDEALLGLADCHLPPGMGSIPLRDSLGFFTDFAGYIILELRPAYQLYFAEAVRWVRDLTNV